MENKGEIKIFNSDDGEELEVKLFQDTVWLSQAQMAELFDRDSDTISLHIKIYIKKVN